MKTIIVTLMLFSFIGVALASEYVAEITQFGIYEVNKPKAIESLGSISGKSQSGKGYLKKETNMIPLEANTFFGFNFKISNIKGPEKKLITIVINHPPMITPNGKVKTKQSDHYWKIPDNGAIAGQNGYVLNHGYEMVTGAWNFQVFINKELAIEKTFNTVVGKGSNNTLKSDAKSGAL